MLIRNLPLPRAEKQEQHRARGRHRKENDASTPHAISTNSRASTFKRHRGYDSLLLRLLVFGSQRPVEVGSTSVADHATVAGDHPLTGTGGHANETLIFREPQRGQTPFIFRNSTCRIDSTGCLRILQLQPPLGYPRLSGASPLRSPTRDRYLRQTANSAGNPLQVQSR